MGIATKKVAKQDRKMYAATIIIEKYFRKHHMCALSCFNINFNKIKSLYMHYWVGLGRMKYEHLKMLN